MYRAPSQSSDSFRLKGNDGSRPGTAGQGVGAYRPEPPSAQLGSGFTGRPTTSQSRLQPGSSSTFTYATESPSGQYEGQAYQPQQPWGGQSEHRPSTRSTVSQGRLAVDTFASSRPGTAQSSKPGSGSGVSVYTNSMYDAGDILGGTNTSGAQQHSPVSPASPATPGSQKMQQQRSLAAQKRLERLQMNGVAQSNLDSSSRPGSARSSNSGDAQAAPARLPSHTHSLSNLSSSLRVGSFSMDSSLGEQAVFPASPVKGSRADARLTTGRTAASETEMALMAKGVATVYDPTEEAAAVRPNGPKDGALPRAKADISNMVAFLTQPVGRGQGTVMCYIERDKGALKADTYRLYLDDGRHFLLAARKRKTSTSSQYILTMDSEDLGRSSKGYVGKLRSNFVGTEFVVFDNGTKQAKGNDGSPRKEIGAVVYDYNVLGTRGPRRMTAAIPAIDAVGRSRYKPANADDSLLARLREQRHLGELLVLHNKPPKWNEQLNAYCLNFSGRVTEASVKNFQLVAEDAPEHVVLQFGKIAHATFTMDMQWPISPIQAFAICLSSFDNKLACE